jgi:hypothetical protein
MEEVIPLREILMKRGGVADMKRADMLNEKTMNNTQKQQVKPSPVISVQ